MKEIDIELPPGIDIDKLSAAVADAKVDASHKILARMIEKQRAKIAAMTPEERADFERRQATREKLILDGADTTPHEWKSMDEFLDCLRDELLDYLESKDGDIVDAAHAEGRRQGVEAAANLPGIIRGMKEAAREGAKKAVETTLPKAYAKTANMSGDELREATKPKTHSYGGRKKERDLDDAQVKAVLALSPAGHRRPIMECCAEIIRKGGRYQNPYETAKDLAAAVRRYCKRTKTKATFADHKGAWSAKS